tara:strand:- start:386 stop:559 length:174 start_codon:yes stop_codon:yes gene_type:complete
MSEELEVYCVSKRHYVITFENQEQKQEWLEERNTNDMFLEYEVEEWNDGKKEETEYR